jgi:hypothetical protein
VIEFRLARVHISENEGGDMDHLEQIRSLEPKRRTQVFKILMETARKVETDPGVKEFLAVQYVWAKEEEKRTRKRVSNEPQPNVTGDRFPPA